MTTIECELPDQKRKPMCNIKVTLMLTDNATVAPLSYERSRHRGVKYYDQQRMKQKLSPIVHPRDFAGYSCPPLGMESFGKYCWDYDKRDYVEIDE